MTWTEWPEYGPTPCVSLYQQDLWLQQLEGMSLRVQPMLGVSTVGSPLAVTLEQRGMVAVNTTLVTVTGTFDTLRLEDASTGQPILSIPYGGANPIRPGELSVRFI